MSESESSSVESVDESFSRFALAPKVLEAIDDVGYESPSPIQRAAIPPLLEGRDLVGQAQTGTGKTAAFALPILSRMDLSLKEPQALVLTPTRELALQVAEAIQTYARHLRGLHVLPVYGGQSIETQLRRLRRGVHAVVGTPGRILDHLQRRTLRLERLRTVVLDEADELLRMGFIDDVERILEQTPETKQVALFSATMPERIKQVAARHMIDSVEVRIKTKTATVAATSQRYWQVTDVHKLDALTRILAVEDFDAMLVFVRTRKATAELAEKLEARGFSSSPLSGDMSQGQRERTVARLRRGDLDIVVATDVAARGLDVDRISHVVNYDVPYDVEAYVHRIGRTGRAGRAGQAILFVSPRERRMLRAIERATRKSITPMKLPTGEDIADRRVEHFKQKIVETIESEELSFFESLVEGYQQEHNNSLSEVAAALAFLLQKENPLRPKLREGRKEAGKSASRPSSRPPAAERPVADGMERYRIEVGREHNVGTKHIVGAIANEADIDGEFVGPISIHESYSTVDLPEGMPKAVTKHLRKLWVCGRQLKISLLRDGGKRVEKKGHKPAKRQGKGPRKASHGA